MSYNKDNKIILIPTFNVWYSFCLQCLVLISPSMAYQHFVFPPIFIAKRIKTSTLLFPKGHHLLPLQILPNIDNAKKSKIRILRIDTQVLKVHTFSVTSIHYPYTVPHQGLQYMRVLKSPNDSNNHLFILQAMPTWPNLATLDAQPRVHSEVQIQSSV